MKVEAGETVLNTMSFVDIVRGVFSQKDNLYLVA